MLSILILAIVALSLIAVGGYSALSLYQSASNLSAAQQNKVRMSEVALVLEANLRAIALDGVSRVPMGEAAPEGWTGLPAWLGAPASTPWGVSYGYCPYAPDNVIATGGTTVALGDGATYVVDTTSNSASGGQAYVSGSVAPPVSGVLALVISPALNAQTMPSCADVSYTGGRFVVPGGQVVAVTRGFGHAQSIAAASRQVQLHVAPSGSGDQSGSDPANPMTLEAAFALWKAVSPAHMKLQLAAGSYEVPVGAVNFSSDLPEDHLRQTVTLAGAGSGTTTLSAGPGASFTFAIPGARVAIRDLTFGAGSTLHLLHNDAILRNGAFRNLEAKQSRISLHDALSFASSATASYSIIAEQSDLVLDNATVSVSGDPVNSGGVWIADGSLDIDSSSTLSLSVPDATPGVVLLGKARGVVRGGSISVTTTTGNPASLVSVGPLAAFEAESGSVLSASNGPASALYVRGRAVLSGTVLSLPNGAARSALVDAGGTLVLEDGSVLGASSNPPQYGVVDNGARSFIGGSATVYAVASCWTGDLFSRSNDINNGSSAPSSNPTPDAIQVLNRSTWTCKR